jgi:hypothetical protein
VAGAIVVPLLHTAAVMNIRGASFRARAYAAKQKLQGRRCYGCVSLEACPLLVIMSVHFP